jgi:ligand-binding sensor domain-containing protein
MNSFSLRFLLGILGYFSIFGLMSLALAEDYPKKMNFRNIMQNEDIAIGEVEAIVQDHEGFMWLGGRNALLRYDGYEFLPIPIVDKGKSRTDAPPVKQVADILEDKNHQLWIGSRIGLLKYDRDSEVAMHLDGADEAAAFLNGNTVNALAQVSVGELIVATNAGLFIVDIATQHATKLEHKEGDANSIPNNTIYKVLVDKKGTVWLGVDSGLVAVDWATKKATLYVPDPEHSKSVPDNSVRTMAIDLNGELWLGVAKGLYRFNPTTAHFKRYRNDPNDRFSLGDDYSRDVYVDKHGWVWVGSDGAGVSLYDATNDRFIRFQYEDGRVGSLSSNTIRKIFQDDNGDLWVGTYPSGVNYHDHSTAAITVYKKENNTGRGVLDNNIESIVEDKNGNLWIGGGGVTRYNPDDETFRYYQKGTAHNFNSTSAIGSGKDSDGDIWFGTWANSYQRYNAATDQFDQMPADATLSKKGLKTSDKLIDNVVWSIYEDKQKNLWLGTHNSGLNKYDKKTGTYINYEPSADPTSLSNTAVWMSFEDSHGNFWVGTSNGLNLMDREKGTFKHYISHPENPRALASGSVLMRLKITKAAYGLEPMRAYTSIRPRQMTSPFTIRNQDFLIAIERYLLCKQSEIG